MLFSSRLPESILRYTEAQLVFSSTEETALVEEFDMQQSQHAMRMMTTALYNLGVKAYPKSSIVKSTKGKITILHEAGVEMAFQCNAVVKAADMLPNTELYDSIDVAEKYIIGDAKNPFNIALAIRDGNDVGRSL